jgi:hypothetical protein
VNNDGDCLTHIDKINQIRVAMVEELKEKQGCGNPVRCLFD